MCPIRAGAYALILAVAMGGCESDQANKQTAGPPPPEVAVSQVVGRDVTDSAEYTGRTDSVETVDVRARVTGYLEEIGFTDGQEVNKGDFLFQIDPRPFKADLDNANGQKAMWQAKLARAKADVARYEKLVPTGAATPQDLDKARADMGESVAAIASADATIERAKLNLTWARITAPIGGQISKTAITNGNLVRGDNDLLTTIVSLDPIYVNFNVDERALLEVRERTRNSQPPTASRPDMRTLKLPVYVGLANEQGYPHKGIIDFADNRVDPDTGTILLRGKFDNSKRIFKPGFFARVRVPLGQPYKALLISDRAIGTDQSQKFVYVVDDQNLARYRVVKLGRLEDDGLRVITDGLKPNDSVIVTGLQRARPGKPVNPQRIQMPQAGQGAETRPVTVAADGKNIAKAGVAAQH